MSSRDQSRTERSLAPRLLALVFAPFAAGFFFSYALRNANAVIARDLAAEFSLSPADVGLLTSMYLLSFAAMHAGGGFSRPLRAAPRGGVATRNRRAGRPGNRSGPQLRRSGARPR